MVCHIFEATNKIISKSKKKTQNGYKEKTKNSTQVTIKKREQWLSWVKTATYYQHESDKYTLSIKGMSPETRFLTT